MDKNTSKSTLNQLFKPIKNEKFLKKVADLGLDKYAKKLTVIKLIQMVAYAQLEQHEGLRQISNSLQSENFSNSVDLESISASQLSRKIREIPTELIQLLFKEVVQQVARESPLKPIMQKLGRTYLIDSSTISLCVSQYRWAEFRKTKSGIKLHLRIKLFEDGVLPDSAVITPAKHADKTQMDALVVEEKDILNVFDRGYIDYKKFDQYCEKGIRFVSRLKSNALVEILENHTLNPDGLIKKDQTVILGKNGATKMKCPLRIIETEDTKGSPVIIVTNDFKLGAEEIGEIYRSRWQIELFFKWIKQHLFVKHFYSTSQQAVENQILIALITYCLLMLLRLKAGYEGTLLTLKRLLHTCIYDSFEAFVSKLHRKPGRVSRGRRRVKNEQIYQETVEQVLANEIDHLNDLTYDPVIL